MRFRQQRILFALGTVATLSCAWPVVAQTVVLSPDEASATSETSAQTPTPDETSAVTPFASEGAPADLANPAVFAPSIPSAGEALPPIYAAGPVSPHRPFHLVLGVDVGYDDNVNTTSVGDQQGSGFVATKLGLNYLFGSPRTRLAIQTNGGLTYYFDRPGQESPDYNASLGVTLTHRFSPRLTFDAAGYLTYQAEPNFSLNTGVNQRTGNYLYANYRMGLTYEWLPRFLTETSYILNALIHEGGNAPPQVIGQPFAQNNDDHIDNTFSQEFRFLLLPTTSLIAEYRLEFVSYASATSFDSTTHFALVGVNHTFSPRLSASLRGGGQFRSYESGGDDASPYFEGTVIWVLGRRSVLTWTGQYGIQEANTIAAQQRTNFHTGLNFLYNWTARISSNLAVYYNHDEFQTGAGTATSRTDDTIDATLTAHYAITRLFGITAGYSHTSVFSDQPQGGYDRNRIYLGGTFAF